MKKNTENQPNLHNLIITFSFVGSGQGKDWGRTAFPEHGTTDLKPDFMLAVDVDLSKKCKPVERPIRLVSCVSPNKLVFRMNR